MNGQLLQILIIWNVVVFALFGIDKRRAVKNKWRISEKTLITCAFLMGGTGALFGMSMFRHKTKKTRFRVLIPLAAVLNYLIIIFAERM